LAIPAIAAQLAVPVAAQLFSKLLSPAAQPDQTAAPPAPKVAPHQQQLLATITGKGLKINTFA